MKKIIVALTVTASLLFALPPEIKRDQYLQAIKKDMKAKNYAKAKKNIIKLDRLSVMNQNIQTPAYIYYFKAVLLQKEGYNDDATQSAERYLKKTGTKGKYYTEILSVLDAIENPVTFFDSESGLIWQDNQDAGGKVELDWDGAMRYCSELTFEGSSDWRLPSKDELIGLYSKKNSLVNIASDLYWSSSVSVSDSSEAWGVYFRNGRTYGYLKSFKLYVRCVRGRQ